MPCIAWVLLSVAVLLPERGYAQTSPPGDTLSGRLDPIVVTADRTAGRLSTSTASVTVLSDADLAARPGLDLDDHLLLTPGLTFVHLDGLGHDPQPMQRGFYGGGEAEYVVVLWDGLPLNDVERGLVDWRSVPLLGVEQVESVRGSTSALYGDAAVAGVVNLRSQRAPEARFRASVGSYGMLRGGASVVRPWGARAVHVFGQGLRSEGYRDHAERTHGSLGATVRQPLSERQSLRIQTLHTVRDAQVPGPITVQSAGATPTLSDPFYRFDRTEERRHRLGITWQLDQSKGEAAVGVLGEWRSADQMRTLALSPGFADTQLRTVGAGRLLLTAQLTRRLEQLWEATVVLGGEAALHHLDSRYRAVMMGTAEQYAAADGAAGAVLTDGTVRRQQGALFAQANARPLPSVQITLGARLDAAQDVTGDAGEQARPDADHLALSPKLGVNVRALSTRRQVLNVYGSVSRSFKAPTLDQRYDQRLIPFGDFAVSLSNPALKPQHGVSLEVGTYHRMTWGEGQASELHAAAYHIDMEDELDFSLESFSYVNIGASRHRGVEVGGTWTGQRWQALANYALQHTTLRYGDFEGNFVKAIPRDVFSGGVVLGGRSAWTGAVTAHGARRIFLDDANTERLPNWWRLDAQLGYRIGSAELSLEVLNALDRSYSTTGYQLADFASGELTTFLYPAAGRTFRLRLDVRP